jgi:hypothetical protein
LRRMSVAPPSNSAAQRIAAYFGQFKDWDPTFQMQFRGQSARLKRAVSWLQVRQVAYIDIGPHVFSVNTLEETVPLADTYPLLRRRLGLDALLPRAFFDQTMEARPWRKARCAFEELCAKRLPHPYAEQAFRAFVEIVHIEGLLYSLGRADEAAQVGSLGQVFKEGNFPVAYASKGCTLYVLCSAPPRRSPRPAR